MYLNKTKFENVEINCNLLFRWAPFYLMRDLMNDNICDPNKFKDMIKTICKLNNLSYNPNKLMLGLFDYETDDECDGYPEFSIQDKTGHEYDINPSLIILPIELFDGKKEGDIITVIIPAYVCDKDYINAPEIIIPVKVNVTLKQKHPESGSLIRSVSFEKFREMIDNYYNYPMIINDIWDILINSEASISIRFNYHKVYIDNLIEDMGIHVSSFDRNNKIGQIVENAFMSITDETKYDHVIYVIETDRFIYYIKFIDNKFMISKNINFDRPKLSIDAIRAAREMFKDLSRIDK